MKNTRTLDTISVGESLYIVRLDISAAVAERLQDLGVSAGAMVRSVGESPLGDPIMLVAGGRVFAARRRDLRSIVCDGEHFVKE